jgi:hypothetical protein
MYCRCNNIFVRCRKQNEVIVVASRHTSIRSSSAIVEKKVVLNASRDLRDALVQLAGTLEALPLLRGYLFLQDPDLSADLIEREVSGFKKLLRSDIANRLQVVVSKEGRLVGELHDLPASDLELLHRGMAQPKDQQHILRRANKQDEVVLAFLHAWTQASTPVTSQWLASTVGCNYRTVASTIEQLGRAIERHSNRSVSLKYFPEKIWARIVARAYTTRSSMYFVDASGQPRSPDSLVRRLNSIRRDDIALGGVLGARSYQTELDIVGSPRLDLTLHCPGTSIDLDFIRQLDPALKQTRDTQQPVQLALHFVRRNESFFQRSHDGTLFADPIECLLGLYDASLTDQARSFQAFLITKRSLANDDS